MLEWLGWLWTTGAMWVGRLFLIYCVGFFLCAACGVDFNTGHDGG